MVIKSAIIWVGCQVSVKPFQTGTPAWAPNNSTASWSKPRYSMPSNMEPRTFAVSITDSFLPSWMSLAPRYSGWPPRSLTATVKAARVRVEDFSNNKAIFWPFKYSCGMLRFFNFFKCKAKSIRNSISALV